MMAVGRGAIRQVGRLVAALAAVAVVAGCDWRPSAPENRAEYFIEKFIHEPQALEDLRAVTQLPGAAGPEQLVTDAPTRTAVTYLRARARLGAKLGIHAAGTTQTATDRRRVRVVVTEGVAVGRADAVRFDVELQKTGEDWRVVSLGAD
jgi:hypothetical protein